MKAGATTDITVTPMLSLKLPAMPKRFGNAVKAPSFNVLEKLGEIGEIKHLLHSIIILSFENLH